MKNILLSVATLLSATVSMAQIVEQQWDQSFGFQNSQSNTSADIDASGNVLIAGYTNVASGNDDMVILKYDPNGNLIWNRKYDQASSVDRGNAVTCDVAGNAYLGGSTTNTSGDRDFTVVKYDAAGTQVWVSHTDIAADNGVEIRFNNGLVYQVGYSHNGLNDDGFIRALDAGTGTVLWQNSFDNGGQDRFVNLEFDAAGNVILVGNSDNSGNPEYLVVSYDITGNQNWISKGLLNGTGNDVGNDIKTDAAGNIYISVVHKLAGQRDFAVAKFNNSGVLLSKIIIDKGKDEESVGIELTNSGKVFLTGTSFDSPTKTIKTYLVDIDNEKEIWGQTYYGNEVQSEVKDVTSNGNEVYLTGFTEYAPGSYGFITVAYSMSGGELWNKLYTKPNPQFKQPAKIAISPTNEVYITGQVSATGGFEMATIKYEEIQNVIIPPDFYGEGPSSKHVYYQNKGQVMNIDGTSNTAALARTYGVSPAIYLFEDCIAMVEQDPDTATGIDSLNRVDLKFLSDGVPNTSIGSFEEAEGKGNFYYDFIPGGREGVTGHNRIVYRNISTGIDLHIYSYEVGYKYYYVVNPGANMSNLTLEFNGQSSLTIGSANELEINTGLGGFSWSEPVAFQLDALNNIIPITSWTPSYSLSANQVNVLTGTYDGTMPLVIQIDRGRPVAKGVASGFIGWCSYLDSDVNGFGVMNAVDAGKSESFYTGETWRSVLPNLTGSISNVNSGLYDAIVLGLAGNITTKWYTFYGGSDNENGIVIKFNNTNQHVYTGGTTTTSTGSFPLVDFSPGNSYFDITNNGTATGAPRDLYLARINGFSGALEWSTFYGGELEEHVFDMAINQTTGDIYYGGVNNGGADFQNELVGVGLGDGLILKFNANCEAQFLSRYGGPLTQVRGITTDNGFNWFVTGTTRGGITVSNTDPLFPTTTSAQAGFKTDGYVQKFTSSIPAYGMYFGHSGKVTAGHDIVVDGNSVYVIGEVENSGLFTLDAGGYYQNQLATASTGIFDCYLLKIEHTGIAPLEITWATYFGGEGSESVAATPTGGFDSRRLSGTIDDDGNLYVSGRTTGLVNSGAIEIPRPAFLPLGAYYEYNYQESGTTGPLSQDGFVAAFDNTTKLIWSTLFGGEKQDEIKSIAYSIEEDRVYMAGLTNSINSDIAMNPGQIFFPTREFDTAPISSDFFDGDGRLDFSAFGAFIDVSKINLESTMTSVEDLELEGFSVYPNPTNSEFTVEYENLNNSLFELRVTDMRGRLVNLTTTKSTKLTINTSNWESGIYNISLITDQKVLNEKVVKY